MARGNWVNDYVKARARIERQARTSRAKLLAGSLAAGKRRMNALNAKIAKARNAKTQKTRRK